MSEDHVCRAGKRCTARTRTEDGKGWTPAATINPNSLCNSCIRWVESETAALWADYLALHRIVGERPNAQHEGGKRPDPTSQIPLNVHVDALMRDIVDTVERAAEQIADILHIDNPEHPNPTALLAAGLAIVEPNITILSRVGKFDAQQWNDAGDKVEALNTDGPTLCLKLAELHHHAQNQLGETRGRDRMPVPCPRCEHSALGRWHGADNVDCLHCGSSWTESDYKRMTLILADDYQELAR